MLEIKELGVKISFTKGFINHPRLNEERFSYACGIELPDKSFKCGFAYLNPRDNNNKKLGKIIALRKALKEIGESFNRQQRSIIWDEFWRWLNNPTCRLRLSVEDRKDILEIIKKAKENESK